MVNMVEEELKMEVREDMRAASMTAIMAPRIPAGISSVTSFTKAMLLQLDLDWQMARQASGLAQATWRGLEEGRGEEEGGHLVGEEDSGRHAGEDHDEEGQQLRDR